MLRSTGQNSLSSAHAWHDAANRLRHATNDCLGFPSYNGFSPGELDFLLGLPINNIGDPFLQSRSGTHLHDLELAVLSKIASLAGLNDKNVRGYVTSGSTEAVIHALHLGRDTVKQNGTSKPVIIASDQCHGCVVKAARLLDTPLIQVASAPDGSIDINSFAATLAQHAENPCLVVATAGTTFLGGIDRTDLMVQALEATHRGRYRLHVDAALGGFLLPYTQASGWNLESGGHSYSVSGHKMVGVPIPCGIVIWEHDAYQLPNNHLNYLCGPDTTLTGSRSGLAVGALWLALHQWPANRLSEQAHGCLDRAAILVELLTQAGWPAQRGEFSTTVIFPSPPANMCMRWQLPTEGTRAHVVVTPRVDLPLLERFVASLGTGPGISSGFLPDHPKLR